MKRFKPASSPSEEQRLRILEWHRLYYAQLYQYGAFLTHRAEIVEDIIQDLFLWLLERPEKVDQIQNPASYLHQSLHHNINRVMQNQELQAEKLTKYRTEMAGVLKNADQVTAAIEDRERQNSKLSHYLAQLPTHQREIIFLRYYRGLSYQEISVLLNIKEQVARNFTNRALRTLRKAMHTLRDHFYFFVPCFWFS